MSDYRKDLVARFWEYQKEAFPEWQRYFERPMKLDGRPPVFLKETAGYNVLTEPGLSPAMLKKLLSEIPVNERHRWFTSMTSSQAFAQSVFGNLKIYDRLHYALPIWIVANQNTGR